MAARTNGQAIIFLPCGFCLLLSSFFSPNLNGRRLDIYRTSTHCGLSANLECRSEMCCARLAGNTARKKWPSAHHRTALSAYISHISVLISKFEIYPYLLLIHVAILVYWYVVH